MLLLVGQKHVGSAYSCPMRDPLLTTRRDAQRPTRSENTAEMASMFQEGPVKEPIETGLPSRGDFKHVACLRGSVP